MIANRLVAAALLWGLTSPFVHAQGFAGLGTGASGFAIPAVGQELTFPKDHGAHPEYRIEWWYLTANLETPEGEELGVQWTLFRSALRPKAAEGWSSDQVWMGHAALTEPDRHHVAERFGRGGTGQAGVSNAPFHAWIDDWEMTSPDDTLNRLSLSARGDTFSYNLELGTDAPLVLHGEAGYSIKSQSGQASYYYAQPSYSVTGTVEIDGTSQPVVGNAWLDREWSSQPLDGDQTGWDWFSLRFDTGEKLMGFILRSETGDYSSGTWISPDNRATPLEPGMFRATPIELTRVSDRDVPTTWRVEVADHNVDVVVKALNPRAWMATQFPYWEGPVEVSGSHQGRGYMEMTGYGDARSNNPSNR